MVLVNVMEVIVADAVALMEVAAAVVLVVCDKIIMNKLSNLHDTKGCRNRR